MPDPTSRLAKTVLAENLKVRKGESVLIDSWTHGLPLARAFAAEARRLGAHATTLYEDESGWWEAVGKKNFAGVGSFPAAEKAAVSGADVFIHIWGPEDRPRLEALPDKTREAVTAFNESWYDTAIKSGVRGVRLTVGLATDPVAKNWGLDGQRWRRRLMEAGMVSGPEMRAAGGRLAKKIQTGSTMRVRHSNGTDLTFQLSGAKTRIAAGIVDAEAKKRRYGVLADNPSGQILVSIPKSGAEGTFVGNRTVYFGDQVFGDTRWTFERGRLVSHSNGRGSELFEKGWKSAPAGKDRLGYFSIGLNPKARDLPPVEDTEEGAIILGIGNNQLAAGAIKIPFMGFALLGEGTITIDGTTVASGGRLR